MVVVTKVLGGENPADALTKAEGAHFAPMAKLLSTSRFCIREEAEELMERKATKDVLGYVPRPRSAPEKATKVVKYSKSVIPEEAVEDVLLQEMS